jgi:hypothetical protein
MHKGETEAVRQRHGTDAGKVLVKVCNHPALEKIRELQAEAYAKHISLTLPTIQDGSRLLPAGREMEHASIMGALKPQYDASLSQFLMDYPAAKTAAPTVLNGLYDPSMWPDDVSLKFALSVKYLICPTAGEWGEWLAESAQAATTDLMERLEKSIKRIAVRCKDDGKLFATVFTNLQDLLADIPEIDIADDPQIQRMAAMAKSLAANDSKDLRDKPETRKNVAAEAERILSIFSQGSLA